MEHWIVNNRGKNAVEWSIIMNVGLVNVRLRSNWKNAVEWSIGLRSSWIEEQLD